jgi:hypothetical protein
MKHSGHSSANGLPDDRAIDLGRAVDRAELRHDPFDHIYMEQVIGPADYTRLLDHLPAREVFHELRHKDALGPDGVSTRLRLYLYPELLRRLPKAVRDAWLPVAEALTSAGLELAFKRRFRDALEARFARPAEAIRLYPVPILLRDQPGYRIGIHADVLTKAITVQYYLPRDGDQRGIGTIFHDGREGDAAARAVRMPFMPATGYAFVVTDRKSWHSAAMTTAADGERISMMVTYYAAESPRALAKWRLQRLRMRFGWHPER